MKAMQFIEYKLPWQPNHQIVSDFSKKQIKGIIPFLTNDQIDYLYTFINQYLIINTKIKIYK